MHAERRLRTLLAGAALTLVAANSHAYCRTTTAHDSIRDADGCLDEGLPLLWRSSCVGYRLSRRATTAVTPEAAEILVRRAFREWTNAAGQCAPTLNVVELADTDTAEPEYNRDGPNENVIIFRDDWHYEIPDFSQLEFTTLTFRSDTGEILDADIEINTNNVPYFIDVSSDAGAGTHPDQYDFGAVLTHAAGHFLGFAHSQKPDSIMAAAAPPGDLPRPLVSADDAKGMCETYPDGRTSSACNLAEVGSCGGLDVSHGCAISASNGEPGLIWVGGLLAMIAITRARRARCARARHVVLTSADSPSEPESGSQSSSSS